MLEAIKDIVFVNAYWFSMPIAGYGLLLLLKRVLPSNQTAVRSIDFALNRHFVGKAFISLAFVVAVLGLVSFVGYLFGFPIVVASVLYIAMLIVGVAYLLFLFVKRLFSTQDIDIIGAKGEPLLVKLTFLLLVAVAFADFALSLYAKSHAALGSDTYVHLSRIVTIISQGFTTESGFFGNVPEVGYHTNVIYTLYAIPAQLFNISPSRIWEYSYGFWRLLIWASFFTLAWHIWTGWLKNKAHAIFAASLATLFAITFFNFIFFIAVYPNQIVITWLILLVLALSAYETRVRASVVPLFVAAFLITMTHSAYALMSAMCLGVILLLRLLFEKKDFLLAQGKKDIAVYLTSIAILMFGPVRSALFPNRMTEAGFNIGRFPTWEWGPIAIKAPHNIFQDSLLQITLLVLGTCGLLFLVRKLWHTKRQLSIVLGLILFFPLMVYVPLTFSVLQVIFPLWVIERFNAMNILTYVSVPLGIYGLLGILRQYVIGKGGRLSRLAVNQQVAFIVPAALILGLSACFVPGAPQKLTQYREQNSHYYTFMEQSYEALHTVLKDNKVVVAATGDSYFLASVLPVDVIAIEEGHTTPSADAINRLKCQGRLMTSFAYEDLRTVSADYVVIAKYDPQYEKQRQKVDASPYLKLVTTTNSFYVYRFDPSEGGARKQSQSFPACTAYQETER